MSARAIPAGFPAGAVTGTANSCVFLSGFSPQATVSDLKRLVCAHSGVHASDVSKVYKHGLSSARVTMASQALASMVINRFNGKPVSGVRITASPWRDPAPASKAGTATASFAAGAIGSLGPSRAKEAGGAPKPLAALQAAGGSSRPPAAAANAAKAIPRTESTRLPRSSFVISLSPPAAEATRAFRPPGAASYPLLSSASLEREDSVLGRAIAVLSSINGAAPSWSGMRPQDFDGMVKSAQTDVEAFAECGSLPASADLSAAMRRFHSLDLSGLARAMPIAQRPKRRARAASSPPALARPLLSASLQSSRDPFVAELRVIVESALTDSTIDTTPGAVFVTITRFGIALETLRSACRPDLLVKLRAVSPSPTSKYWRPLPHEALYSDVLALRALAFVAGTPASIIRDLPDPLRLPRLAARDLQAALRVNPESTAAMEAYVHTCCTVLDAVTYPSTSRRAVLTPLRLALLRVHTSVMRSASLRALTGDFQGVVECIDDIAKAASVRDLLTRLHSTDVAALTRVVGRLHSARRLLLADRFPTALDVAALVVLQDPGEMEQSGFGTQDGVRRILSEPLMQRKGVTLPTAPTLGSFISLCADMATSATLHTGPVYLQLQLDHMLYVMFRGVFTGEPCDLSQLGAVISRVVDTYERMSAPGAVLVVSGLYRLMLLAARLRSVRSLDKSVSRELAKRVDNLFDSTVMQSRAAVVIGEMFSALRGKPACHSVLVLAAFVRLSGVKVVPGSFRAVSLDDTSVFSDFIVHQCGQFRMPLSQMEGVYGYSAFSAPHASFLQKVADLVSDDSPRCELELWGRPSPCADDLPFLLEALTALDLPIHDAHRMSRPESGPPGAALDSSRLDGFDIATNLERLVRPTKVTIRDLHPRLLGDVELAVRLPFFSLRRDSSGLFSALVAISVAARTCCLKDMSAVFSGFVGAIRDAWPAASRVASYFHESEGTGARRESIPLLCALYRCLTRFWHFTSCILESAGLGDGERVREVCDALVDLDDNVHDSGHDLTSVLDACLDAATAAGELERSDLYNARNRVGILTFTAVAVPLKVAVAVVRPFKTRLLASGGHLHALSSSSDMFPHLFAVSVTGSDVSAALDAGTIVVGLPAPRQPLRLLLPLPPYVDEIVKAAAATRRGKHELSFHACDLSTMRPALRVINGVMLTLLIDVRMSLFYAAGSNDVARCEQLSQLGMKLDAADVLVAAANACVAEKPRAASWMFQWLAQSGPVKGLSLNIPEDFAAQSLALYGALGDIPTASPVAKLWDGMAAMISVQDVSFAARLATLASGTPSARSMQTMHLLVYVLSGTWQRSANVRRTRLTRVVASALGESVARAGEACPPAVLQLLRVIADPATASLYGGANDDVSRHIALAAIAEALQKHMPHGGEAAAAGRSLPTPAIPSQPASIPSESTGTYILRTAAVITSVAPDTFDVPGVALVFGNMLCSPAARGLGALELASLLPALPAQLATCSLAAAIGTLSIAPAALAPIVKAASDRVLSGSEDGLAWAKGLMLGLRCMATDVPGASMALVKAEQLKAPAVRASIASLEARAAAAVGVLLKCMSQQLTPDGMLDLLGASVREFASDVTPVPALFLDKKVREWLYRARGNTLARTGDGATRYELLQVAESHAVASAGRVLEARLNELQAAQQGASRSAPSVLPVAAQPTPDESVAPAASAVPVPSAPKRVKTLAADDDPAAHASLPAEDLDALIATVLVRTAEQRAARAAARAASLLVAQSASNPGGDAVPANAASPAAPVPSAPPLIVRTTLEPSASSTCASSSGVTTESVPLTPVPSAVAAPPVDGDEDDSDTSPPFSLRDFEAAPWDVRCVARVVDRLCDASFPWVWHAQAIRTIQRLSTGVWQVRSRQLRGEVQGAPPGMMLFEARINRSRRVLWEIATEFSERLNRAGAVDAAASSPSSSRGLGGPAPQIVYSHVIRVWALIYDHDDISAEVARVAESHRKGGLSNVKRLLKVANGNEPARHDGAFVPRRFLPMSDDAAKRLLKQARLATTSMTDAAASAMASGGLLVTLPAKPGVDEFVPEKFFSAGAVFNSLLVDQARGLAQQLVQRHQQQQAREAGSATGEADDDEDEDEDEDEEGGGAGRASASTDLQFVTSPLEHSIITLNPRPPSSIVVLGRSGTGKTVCVLYRLFSLLLTYWDESVGGPSRPPAFPNNRPPLVELLHRRYLQEQQQGRCIARGALAGLAEVDEEDSDDDGAGSIDSEAERRAANDEMLARGGIGEDLDRAGSAPVTSTSAQFAAGSLDGPGLQDHDGFDGHSFHSARGSIGSNVEQDDGALDIDDSLDGPHAHLRQVFLTRSERLRSGVLRAFRGLQRSQGAVVDPATTRVRYLFPVPEYDPLPSQPVIPPSLHYRDATKTVFPLFLSSREWLHLLDSTLGGGSFFSSRGVGATAAAVAAAAASARSHASAGASSDRSVTPSSVDEESAIADELSDGGSSFGGTATRAGGGGDASTVGRLGFATAGAWTGGEVSFREFEQLWPKLAGKRGRDSVASSLSAAIVYKEIRSNIRGSDEALLTKYGRLPLARDPDDASDSPSYLEFPSKRCPHGEQARREIYRLYLQYERLKVSLHAYDEADFVCDLYRRLVCHGYSGVPLHQLYVDEVQDHTQAEIKLFILLCADPNALFLAGDTAQAISSGVAFRFADIRSLFYQQQQLLLRLSAGTDAGSTGEQQLVIGVPRLHQLTQNYRSHSGILDVAASVVSLISHLFPNSIDRLERDRGLYPGPKPRLILGSDVNKLAIAMTGGARVEFGAEQVVIVRDEAAKRRLPPALRAAIVMTPAECKGLEFDDALLWDFFADSPAGEAWRTLPAFLTDMASRASNDRAALDDLQLSGVISDSLVRLDDDEEEELAQAAGASPSASQRRSGLHPWPTDCPTQASSVPARPLSFDPLRHNALEGELKALYVAVTRARKRLFIFDRGGAAGVKECDWPRTSAFEFLERQGLVETLSESQASEYAFAVASTAEQWHRKGRHFKEAARLDSPTLYLLAAQCFERGAAPVEAALCRALYYARLTLTKQRSLSFSREGRAQDARDAKRYAALAAEQYLHTCSLGSAKVGRLYLTKAALCLRVAGSFAAAARIYEGAGQTDKAVACHVAAKDAPAAAALLRRIGRPEEAIGVLVDSCHYEKAIEAVREAGGRSGAHTIPSIARKGLFYCAKFQAQELRERILPLVPFASRLEILRGAGDWRGVVEAHVSERQYSEAALMLLARGDLCAVASAADVLQHAMVAAIGGQAVALHIPPLLAACKLRVGIGCLTLLGLPPWLYAGALCASSALPPQPSFRDLATCIYGEPVAWPTSLVGGEPVRLPAKVIPTQAYNELVSAASEAAIFSSGSDRPSRLTAALALARATIGGALYSRQADFAGASGSAVSAARRAFEALQDGQSVLQSQAVIHQVAASAASAVQAAYAVTLLVLTAVTRLTSPSAAHDSVDLSLALLCYRQLSTSIKAAEASRTALLRSVSPSREACELLRGCLGTLLLPLEWARMELGVTGAHAGVSLPGAHSSHKSDLPACSLADDVTSPALRAALESVMLIRDTLLPCTAGSLLALGMSGNASQASVGCLAVLDPLLLAGNSVPATRLSETAATPPGSTDPLFIVAGPPTHSVGGRSMIAAVANSLLRAAVAPALTLARGPLLELLSSGASSLGAIEALAATVRLHDAASRLPADQLGRVVRPLRESVTLPPSAAPPSDASALVPRVLPPGLMLFKTCVMRLLRNVIDTASGRQSGHPQLVAVLAERRSIAASHAFEGRPCVRLDALTCAALASYLTGHMLPRMPLQRLLSEPALLLEAWMALAGLDQMDRFQAAVATVQSRFGCILRQQVVPARGRGPVRASEPTQQQWDEFAAAQAFNIVPLPVSKQELSLESPLPVGDQAGFFIPAKHLANATDLGTEPPRSESLPNTLSSITSALTSWLQKSVMMGRSVSYQSVPGTDLSTALSIAERALVPMMVATARLAAVPSNRPATLLLPTSLLESCLGAGPWCWGLPLTETSDTVPQWLRAILHVHGLKNWASRLLLTLAAMHNMAPNVCALLERATAACVAIDAAHDSPETILTTLHAAKRALMLALVALQALNDHRVQESDSMLLRVLTALTAAVHPLMVACAPFAVSVDPALAAHCKHAMSVLVAASRIEEVFKQSPPVINAYGIRRLCADFTPSIGVELLHSLCVVSDARLALSTSDAGCAAVTILAAATFPSLRIDALVPHTVRGGDVVPTALRPTFKASLALARTCTETYWSDPKSAYERVAPQESADRQEAARISARQRVGAFLVSRMRRNRQRTRLPEGWELGLWPEGDAFQTHRFLRVRLMSRMSTFCSACGQRYRARDDEGSATVTPPAALPRLKGAKGPSQTHFLTEEQHFPNLDRMRAFLVLHADSWAPAMAHGRASLTRLRKLTWKLGIAGAIDGAATSAVGVSSAASDGADADGLQLDFEMRASAEGMRLVDLLARCTNGVQHAVDTQAWRGCNFVAETRSPAAPGGLAFRIDPSPAATKAANEGAHLHATVAHVAECCRELWEQASLVEPLLEDLARFADEREAARKRAEAAARTAEAEARRAAASDAAASSAAEAQYIRPGSASSRDLPEGAEALVDASLGDEMQDLAEPSARKARRHGGGKNSTSTQGRVDLSAAQFPNARIVTRPLLQPSHAQVVTKAAGAKC